jgi:hypothetical protein
MARAMDIEGQGFRWRAFTFLQVRPETVKSQAAGKAEHRYKLKSTGTALQWKAAGQKLNRPGANQHNIGPAWRCAGQHDRSQLVFQMDTPS